MRSVCLFCVLELIYACNCMISNRRNVVRNIDVHLLQRQYMVFTIFNFYERGLNVHRKWERRLTAESSNGPSGVSVSPSYGRIS